MSEKVVKKLMTFILFFSIGITTFMALPKSGYADNLSAEEIQQIQQDIQFSLIINYGQRITENNQVTIHAEIIHPAIEPDMFQLQFSLDHESWYGYKGGWALNEYSSFQQYYPAFSVGSFPGSKTVYGRIYYQGVFIEETSATIVYSPINERPEISEPIFVEDQSISSKGFQESYIMGGSGTKENPYTVNEDLTKIIIDTPNSTEGMYSLDGKNWSTWFSIENQRINVYLPLSSKEGEQAVYLRTRNAYGIESDTKILYYLLDQSKPVTDIRTKYHSLIATNGKIEFELDVLDQYAKELNFTVELSINGLIAKKEGRVRLHNHLFPTTIPIKIEHLPPGKFSGTVIVSDEAGNQESRLFTLRSYGSYRQ